MKYYTNKARQAGMTLIELTVVLLVLIGLSGLLMPYVSGFISKTHDSTGANNIAEINGAMERYSAQFQGYPDGLDSLINSADGNLYGTTTMADGGTANGGSLLMGPRCLVPHALNMGQAMVLNMGGIDTVTDMNSAAPDATFNSAALDADGNPAKITIENTAVVATLAGTMNCQSSSSDGLMFTDAALRPILARTPNTTVNDYVVFGVGQNSSMMGKVMMSAPVHFAQSGAMSAKNKYNRFGVVFEVPKQNIIANKGYCTLDLGVPATEIVDTTLTDPTAMPAGTCVDGAGGLTTADWTAISPSMQARFAGSVMLMPMVEGLQGAIQRHYDSASEG